VVPRDKCVINLNLEATAEADADGLGHLSFTEAPSAAPRDGEVAGAPSSIQLAMISVALAAAL
jgi:hypothetical protein